MKRDLYAEVSTRIVAELEAGAAPWVKPWSATAGMNTPCNAVTNRPYSGCNVLLLWMAQTAGYRTPRFLTFKQASELGGNVRKGEHGTKVYFVKQLQVHDKGPEDNSATRLPIHLSICPPPYKTSPSALCAENQISRRRATRTA
jgi:antirestriction protein ArdC